MLPCLQFWVYKSWYKIHSVKISSRVSIYPHCTICGYYLLKCNCVCAYLLSGGWLFVTPWMVACQVLMSMEISRQEYWSGFPFPSPGDLSHPRIELMSPALKGEVFCFCFCFLPLSHLRRPLSIIKYPKSQTHTTTIIYTAWKINWPDIFHLV